MIQNEFYFSPINDIIGIKTNREDFEFSYGMAMPPADQKAYEDSLIKIDLNIVQGTVVPNNGEKERMGKFHYFNGFPDKKEVFYERNFIFNRKFQYKISGIDTNLITVIVNKDYYKYVKHRFMNIHSIGYILTDIINLRLLHNGFAPLHCSGFVFNNNGYVIFAPPNTGKTLTTMTLCMKDNAKYKFVAEDLALTDSKFFYSVPWTSTFRYYDTVDTSFFSKSLNKLTDNIPFLGLLGFGKKDPITKYAKDIVHKSKLKGIYILDRGEDFVKDIYEKEAFERINTLDRYEFNYMRAPAIIAYEYFNRDTNIETAYEKERTILKEMIANAEFVKVISTGNAINYSKIIEEDIQK